MNKFFELIKIEFIVFIRDYIALFWTFLFPFLLLVVFMSVSPSRDNFSNTKILFIEGLGYGVERDYFSSLETSITDQSMDAAFNYVNTDTVPDKFPENQIRISLSHSSVNDNEQTMHIIHAQNPSQSVTVLIDIIKLINNSYKLSDSSWIPVSKIIVETRESIQVSSETKTAQKITVSLICMVIISTCLFGFSVVLVQLRASNALKMYQIMPMHKSLYLSAFMISRIIIIVIFSIIFLLIADLLYSLDVKYTISTFINFIVLVSIGAITFICIGVLVASRVTSVSAANGIINLLYFPLVFLSGLFFPISSNLDWLNFIASLLPLKEYAEMFRQIIFNENSLFNYSKTLILMSVWGGVPFLISQRNFVWSSDR